MPLEEAPCCCYWTGQEDGGGGDQGNASINSRNDKANAFFSIVVLLHGMFVLLIPKQEIPIRLVSHLRDTYGRNREASKTEKNTFLYICPSVSSHSFDICFVFMEKMIN